MKKIGIIVAFAGVMLSLTQQAFAGYFNSTPIEKCQVSITSNLQRGSENDDVVRLQNMLARGGYLHATPNGYFGYQTEAAVKAFQRDNGISASGVVGETTRNAVNERMCDQDVVGIASYSPYYGYTSSYTTYVGAEDPYVKVVLPPSSTVTTPVLPAAAPSPDGPFVVGPSTSPQIIATTQGETTSSIVYSPYVGYTYGLTPPSGSVTVTSPVANTAYNEGDTVTVNWFVNNLTPSTYTVLLENTTSGASQSVSVTSGNSATFSLSKDLLDRICSGSCNYGNQNSYRIVVSTPTKDIAGNVSTLRAAVQPIIIKRQFLYSGQVSITTNKSPVNSGENFKLYVNIPRGASWDSYLAGNYSIKIKATCPSGVMATVAGVSCGQEFVIPLAPVSYQQEVPAMITNGTWFKQNIQFDLTVTNLAGQTIGTSQVNVIANGVPFSW